MKPGHAALTAMTLAGIAAHKSFEDEKSSEDSVRRDPEHFGWQCGAQHPDHPKIRCQYSRRKKHKVHKHVGLHSYYRWEDSDGAI